MYVRISNLRGNWPKFCQGRRSPWCQLGQSLTKPPFFIAVTDSRDWTELASFTSVLQLQYARKPHTSTEKQRQMKKHMHARTHARTHTHTQTVPPRGRLFSAWTCLCYAPSCETSTTVHPSNAALSLHFYRPASSQRLVDSASGK